MLKIPGWALVLVWGAIAVPTLTAQQIQPRLPEFSVLDVTQPDSTAQAASAPIQPVGLQPTLTHLGDDHDGHAVAGAVIGGLGLAVVGALVAGTSCGNSEIPHAEHCTMSTIGGALIGGLIGAVVGGFIGSTIHDN